MARSIRGRRPRSADSFHIARLSKSLLALCYAQLVVERIRSYARRLLPVPDMTHFYTRDGSPSATNVVVIIIVVVVVLGVVVIRFSIP